MSVIESPGHLWTDHLVIDTHRCIVMCKCSTERDADTIAAVLNLKAAMVDPKEPIALLAT